MQLVILVYWVLGALVASLSNVPNILSKAPVLTPNFETAWRMLGDLHVFLEIFRGWDYAGEEAKDKHFLL